MKLLKTLEIAASPWSEVCSIRRPAKGSGDVVFGSKVTGPVEATGPISTLSKKELNPMFGRETPTCEGYEIRHVRKSNGKRAK
jgi:hypothetical protein